MKRIVFLVSLTLILGLIITGCSRGGGNSSATSNEMKEDKDGNLEIQLGSGTQTGNYYPLGAALSKIWNDNVDGVKVSSQATDASVENLQLMKQGKLDMGLTMVGVVNEAYNGEEQFKDNQFEDVRALASLYPNIGQIVARKDEGIDTIEDFEGKGFVPGATGSSTKVLSERMLESAGMSTDDVKAQYVGFSEVTDLMKNKQVVGAQTSSGIPASAVVEILSTANGELVSLTDDQIQFLTDEYPWLNEYAIPKDTYDEQEQDIETVSEANALVVSKSMPEDKAYELTKEMWEHLDELRDSVKTTENMELEDAAKNLSDVPLHPGAKKFYEEEGVLPEE